MKKMIDSPIRRDLKAVRRNLIWASFENIVKQMKIKADEARQLFEEALKGYREEVKEEIRFPDSHRRLCIRNCGRGVNKSSPFTVCAKCRRNEADRKAGNCIDCKIPITARATRCFNCNRKHYSKELQMKKGRG